MKPKLPIYLTAAIILLALAIVYAATRPSPEPAPIQVAATDTDDKAPESDLPIKEFMGHVMQHNAEQFWKWTEVVVDRNGETLGRPKTALEWEQAESDALTLQQLTYTLQHSSLRVDSPEWAPHLSALRRAATDAAKAAEEKNYAALDDASNRINAQCVACHLTFAPHIETPPPVAPD